MAPKRAKQQSYVDLTLDDDYDDEPRPKRRRAGAKQGIPADVADAGTSTGPGPSSQGAGPTSASTAVARGRKKAAAKGPPEEQRVNERGSKVMYRPNASRDVMTRIDRAMPGSAHRMYLVESRQLAPVGSPGGPAHEFHVLGATGNVYEVCIGRHPRCSCPDFAKGHLCKHILFVMLRVLRHRPDNPIIWQVALLTREAEEALAPLTAAASAAAAAAAGSGGSNGAGAAAVDPSVLASEGVRRRYAAIIGGGGAAAAAGGAAAAAGGGGSAGGGGGGVQRPVEGDCPICCEPMEAPRLGGGRGAEAITFCGSCGNNLHSECFKRWASTKRSGGQSVTCVYCRAPWAGGGGGGGGAAAAASPGGGDDSGSPYVNLSQYSEAHREGASLEELYGSNAYFIRAHAGEMGMRQAARMHAAARGWV